MRKYLPLLANLSSEILLGFVYLFLKLGFRMLNNDAALFLMLRYWMAFLTMALLLAFRVIRVKRPGRAVGILVLCGLLNPFLAQFCKTHSAMHVATSRIAMFNSVQPIVMILLAIVLNREYPTRKQAVFSVVTVAGVFIANLGGISAGGADSWLGYLFVAGYILAVAGARVFTRRASAHCSSSDITFYSLCVACLGFTAMGLPELTAGELAEKMAVIAAPAFLVVLLYTSVVSNVMVLMLSSYATARLPFAVYSSTCTISTVIVILSGVFILKEPFTLYQAVGMVVILTGVIGISCSYEKKEARFQSE